MNTKIEKLRETNPEIAISTHLEIDAYFQWDGDGTNPETEGFLSYDVEVRASTIRKGQLFTRSAYLGGVYSKSDAIDVETDVCLDELIDEALEALG